MRCRCWLIVMLIASLSGCGGANERKLAPVSGTVRYRGEPLANASVVFVPEENGVRGANGTTDREGRYRLSTFETNDGARIGSYRVAIRAVESPADSRENPRADQLKPKPVKLLTPARYNAVHTSGLTAEVVAGKNVFEFDLAD